MKLFNELFPVLDYLYIFQTLEYDQHLFLAWFIKHPWQRSLQRKHQLIITSKILLLAFLTIFLIFLISLILAFGFLASLLAVPFLILLNLVFSPFYIITASLFIYPLEYYQKESLFKSAQNKIKGLKNLKIVAIDGSFGKTSTKEMLYTLLWKKFRVVKTPKSYNTKLSIARTILEDLKDNTEIFLVEMDAYHPGEINKLCQLVKPQIGLITSITSQHLERFGSMEKLAKTQFELADNLPENGTLFLNSSDEWIRKLASQAVHSSSSSSLSDLGVEDLSDDLRAEGLRGKTIFYGFKKEDNLSAGNIKQTPEGLSFSLLTSHPSLPITLPLFGKHHVLNFLAAASVALKLGLTLKEIGQRAQWILPTPHRLEIKKQGNLTIIDNTYNTNPTVSQASLKLLKDYPGQEKILITPGLVELGEKSAEENQKFIQEAAKITDQIIIVGENAKHTLLAGLEEINFSPEKIHLAQDLNKAMEILSQLDQPQTVVLLENDLPDQYF